MIFSNYLIRAPLNDHLSHREGHENRSVGGRSAYSYLIQPVRQGGSYGRVDRRGPATVKREILYRVSGRLCSIVGASSPIIEGERTRGKPPRSFAD